MATIRKWFDEHGGVGKVLAWRFSPDHLDQFDAKWPNLAAVSGRVVRTDEAEPLLDIEFDDDYLAFDKCPNFYAWSEDRVFTVGFREFCAGVSEWFLDSMPRNPGVEVKP